MRIPERVTSAMAALAAIAALTCCPAAQAAPHSITGDFSLTANPNGVWSYGWLDRLGGTFTPYNLPSSHTSANGATLDAWQHTTVQSLGAPSAVNNPTSQTFESGTVIIPGGWAAFHPGAQGQLSSFRFTAPSAGNYRMELDFQGADTTSTDVHVWTAGADLFSAPVEGNGVASRKSFARSVPLAAGQTVDVAVGFGSNGYFFDSTAVRGSFNLLPPAPAPVTTSRLPNDFQNTKRSPHHGFEGRVEFAWTFVTRVDETTAAPWVGAAAIAPNGVIYVQGIAFSDPYLYAVKPDGQELWRYDTWAAMADRPFRSATLGRPAVGTDGTIYVVGDDARLHAVNPDGTAQWVASTGLAEGYYMNTAEVRVIPGGRILVSSHFGVDVFDTRGNHLSLMNYPVETGWPGGNEGLTGWLYGAPAVSPDGKTYYMHAVRPWWPGALSLSVGAIQARSVETHQILWSRLGFDTPYRTPWWGPVTMLPSLMVDDDGNIYAAGCTVVEAEPISSSKLENCRLRSFELDGKERWSIPAADGDMLLGLTPDNRRLAFGSYTGEACPGGCGLVTMVDTATGQVAWTFQGQNAGTISLPTGVAVDTTGTVHLGTSAGVARFGPNTPANPLSESVFTFGHNLSALGPNRRLYTTTSQLGLHAYDQVGFVGNTAPVANAGPDQQVVVGTSVALDGSASSDADGNPLTYRWAIDSGPFLGSQQVTGADQKVASFAPTNAGTYVLSLVVNDGTENSAPDLVSVQAITPQQCVAESAAAAIATINGAAAADIDARGHRVALENFVEQGLAAAQNANGALAVSRFGHALRRTDGCTLRGTSDPGGFEQDWLIGCAVAKTAYTHIRRAMDCAALPGLAP